MFNKNLSFFGMMNKKYLMKGLAALALVAGFTSCVKDVDGSSSSSVDEEQKAKENAELQLGFMIPDNQTWDMASQVTANVTVNGDYGAKYTVTIYENNPFINNKAVVLGKADVTSGSTAVFDFTCPNSTVSAFAAIKDAKGYSYVKPVAIVDGKIETTFGGDAAAGSRAMRAARRSAADDFTIPTRTQPDFSAYINDAVAITAENNTTTTDVRHYVIPAGTTWSENIPLIQASDPNDNSIVSVYVLGTMNVNAEQRINGGYGGAYQLIVGDGGVINIADGVTLRSNANQGSGYVGEIHVMAGGTIQGAGKLEFSNGTNSFNYNGGTIDVGTINNNGGTLYNAGVLEADVMEGGAGLSIYENAGKVHIGNCVKGSSTANTRIYNNCWWECDGDIYCRNIQQGAGAYIKGANLGMSGSADGTNDASYIWAKESSLIDIPGYVAFNGVDIVGPTGDGYAYLQFGEATGVNSYQHPEWDSDELGITMNLEGNNTGTYQHPIVNNIRLSVDRPVVQDDMYSQTAYQVLLNALNGTRSCTVSLDPYGPTSDHPEWATFTEWTEQGNGNAVLVQKGQVTDVVTEDECSPGIDIVPPTPIYEELKVYTYAFEDQTLNTDYDMNDVVLKVSYHVTDTNEETGEVVYDKTQLDVKLVAAGATYEIKAKIGENYLFNGSEIHTAMGQNKGIMINTGGTGGNSISGVTPAECTVAAPTGWSGEFDELPVSIEVQTTNKTYSFPNDDVYPHVIMVPTDWAWPTERTNIKDAYAGTSDAAMVEITYTATYTDKENNKLVTGTFTNKFRENSFAAWATSPVDERIGVRNGWYNFPGAKTMTNASTPSNE